MRHIHFNVSLRRLARGLAVAIASVLAVDVHGAVPGITGPGFNLQATPGYASQPDGTYVYTWGYGCVGVPAGFVPATLGGTSCGAMQLPGPTLIVTQGQVVT